MRFRGTFQKRRCPVKFSKMKLLASVTFVSHQGARGCLLGEASKLTNPPLSRMRSNMAPRGCIPPKKNGGGCEVPGEILCQPKLRASLRWVLVVLGEGGWASRLNAMGSAT